MNEKVIILAGPNGAGKTTFARAFLPAEADLPRFINADQIAAGLSAFAPETVAIRAGRLMLEEIAICAKRGDSFAFETTFRAELSSLRSRMAGQRLSGKPVFPVPAHRRNSHRARGAAGQPRRALSLVTSASRFALPRHSCAKRNPERRPKPERRLTGEPRRDTKPVHREVAMLTATGLIERRAADEVAVGCDRAVTELDLAA